MRYTRKAISRLVTMFALGLLTAAGLMPSGALAQPQTREYALKTAFLYHLSQFVDWPRQAGRETFRICVWGTDPFGDQLKALESRTQQDQPIVIAYPQSVAQARECQIVYLAPDARQNASSLIGQLKGLPVLTVSSQNGFVDQGGMVGFVVEQGKVRIEVNAGATRRSKLKMSSKLLELVRRVVDQDSGD